MQLSHLLMVDGDEPELLQPFTLHTIVNDVTQTIQGGALGQFFLGLTDGGRHAEAKPAAIIDFNLHHIFICLKYISSKSPAALKDVFSPPRTLCSADLICSAIIGLL